MDINPGVQPSMTEKNIEKTPEVPKTVPPQNLSPEPTFHEENQDN